MLESSILIVKKAYKAIKTVGIKNLNCVRIKADIKLPTPITPISFNSQSHNFALDFRFSGYIYI